MYMYMYVHSELCIHYSGLCIRMSMASTHELRMRTMSTYELLQVEALCKFMLCSVVIVPCSFCIRFAFVLQPFCSRFVVALYLYCGRAVVCSHFVSRLCSRARLPKSCSATSSSARPSVGARVNVSQRKEAASFGEQANARARRT